MSATIKGFSATPATVVHEGGHAIHRELMNAGGVSPFYASGPHWMFEAFAILNELLLEDRLYRTATDPRAKAYYLHAPGPGDGVPGLHLGRGRRSRAVDL